MKWLLRPIARRLFIWAYWESIVDAHAFIQQKMLEVERNTGLRREYALHEAGGAMEVLVRLRLFEVTKGRGW